MCNVFNMFVHLKLNIGFTKDESKYFCLKIPIVGTWIKNNNKGIGIHYFTYNLTGSRGGYHLVQVARWTLSYRYIF